MILYVVTYKMPNRPIITSRGHTRIGADVLMDIVLRNGGVGNAEPYAYTTSD